MKIEKKLIKIETQREKDETHTNTLQNRAFKNWGIISKGLTHMKLDFQKKKKANRVEKNIWKDKGQKFLPNNEICQTTCPGSSENPKDL